MRFWEWLRHKALGHHASGAPPGNLRYDAADLDDEAVARRVADHRLVVDYFLDVRDGKPPDERFEQRSLSTDFGFISYDVAEILFGAARAVGVPIERAAHFFAVGTYGGGDKYLPVLLRQIEILAGSFDPVERCKLILSGAVGDGHGLVPIFSFADRVDFLVKLCRAVDLLAEQDGHDAVDVRSIRIEEDDGWSR